MSEPTSVAFQLEPRPPRGLELTPDAGLITAIANDYRYDEIFSRQTETLGTPKDAILAFSTSGKSANVLAAVRAPRSNGMLTVAFSGGDGGDLARLTAHAVQIADTGQVQEGRVMLSHLISEQFDATFEAD